jgi:sugar/nucleoside kinase (ribokinase family)
MLLVVGNLTIDEVVLQGKRRTQAGGAALYTPTAAAKMDLSVGVVSKVGYDYPKEHLNEMSALGIDIFGVKILQDLPTTSFLLDYTGDERRLFLRERCKAIEPQDLRNVRAEAAHIAPVFDEVPAETVLELSERCGFLSLDPQGYVRQVTKNGVVEPRAWFDAQVLSRISVFKSSMEELRWISGSENPWKGLERIRESGPEIVAATWGRRGTLMLAKEKRYHVPAFPAQPVDPTGAGDAFIGGFLSQYLRGQDALWSASVGAAIASLLIETWGCRIDASMGEVHERAEWVRERIERL